MTFDIYLSRREQQNKYMGNVLDSCNRDKLVPPVEGMAVLHDGCATAEVV